ncbi:alpha-galactosidase [Flavobacterium gilvum]|uniref:alpha-galactosidase n=1 Tax=Flavobacterium gilvum TaxID=1492737 RepID=UPI0004E38DF3|nr:alpha-galactosidase [Flavobacterium gilvum]KFC60161.1 alpha-galactosidase precursor [Flavobacterium gilvum]
MVKKIILAFLISVPAFTINAQDLSKLPILDIKNEVAVSKDWLVTPIDAKANVYASKDKKSIVLYNGLVRRTFQISPNVACTDFTNLTTNQQLIRAVKPEAKITLDGKEYAIGGLKGQKENAYLLPEWLDKMEVGKEDFTFVNYTISDIKPYINWKPTNWAMNKKQATGKLLTFEYASSLPELKGLKVKVNYELYDGLPLITKSISIENATQKVFKLDRVVSETIAMVEEQSAVEGDPEKMRGQHGFYIETNYAFNNSMSYELSDQTTHWKMDSVYTSQVHYNYKTPCLLEVYPEKAPGIDLNPNDVYNSVRSNELLIDTYDRQRRGLMIKKMYRTIAPWITENPIFMHLVSKNDEQVRTAIDQCAATGYEALILSFGSHLNMELDTPENHQKWKALADYAHSKGVKIGGYSLFSSRRISDEDDVVDPKTGKPGGAFFGGHAPCFGSKWGLSYRDRIKKFYTETGFDIWENDGPYPGDVCASTTHPGHKGLDDSQWKQMEIQKELYRWLNEKGVYINAPDWYFLDGTHKIALGYRERNFSLSREQQRILNRQNIHDGTIEKTASMSWGFVPLTAYQGGDASAVLEPLSEHLKDYQQLMVQYYGAGVQACYRGPRLYDTDVTKELVKTTINWYKKYRDILNSDMIQLRRADGRDWDGFVHVNPALKQKAFIMLYNPTKEKMTKTIKVPLYYSGLTENAKIREKEAVAKNYKINRNYEVNLTFTIEPESYTWYVVE